MSEYQSYMFRYEFQGSQWSFEVPAKSEAEAKMRLGKMANATLDGEVVAKIPVPAGGWLRRVLGLA